MMRKPMSKAETRRMKRFHEVNENGVEIFGDVPIGMRIQLALDPCDELNGKSVADLIVATHQLADVDGLSEENFGVAIDEFLKSD
jgi:hypothetical protein